MTYALEMEQKHAISDSEAEEVKDPESEMNGIYNGNGHAHGGKNGYVKIPELHTVYEVTRPPNEVWKTLLSVSLLIMAWLANDVVLAIVHEKVPRNTNPLPDIWFEHFPEHTDAIKLAEVILCYCIVLALLTMFLHEYRFIVIRRIALILALGYAGRAFCVLVTQVPVPSPKTYCSPKANQTSAGLIFRHAFTALSSLGMDMNGRSLCGDLIYSGHTLLLTSLHLFICRYTPRRLRFLSWTTGFGAVIAVICILIARKHYSIDIVLGYYVSSRIFYNYHSMLELRLRRIDPEQSMITRVGWYSIFAFFEENVKSPLPNNFNFNFRRVLA